MTASRDRAWLVLLFVAWLCAGCAATGLSPRLRPRNEAGAFDVWALAEIQSGQSVRGEPVDTIAVHGGEVLRLELTRPDVRLGERVRAGTGFAETWSSSPATDRTVYVRTTALAAAVLAAPGMVARAYVGHASEPGYYWFELEDRVLAWAEGPLGAPFPLIAPAARIDRDGFLQLDHVLEAAVDAASAARREESLEEARAIRRVAGLRATRALRPPIGYPYFFDSAPVTNGVPHADRAGHAWYEVSGAPLELGVDGPAILHLWAKAEKGDHEETIELEIFEGDRERASRGGTIPPSATPPAPASEPATLPLRRALVHVPPGHHSYRVAVRGGTAFVYPLVAKPVIHIEDALAGRKSEEAQLAKARRGCTDAHEPALCVLALALAGDDHPAADPTSALDWPRARAAASPQANAIADDLASGGPRDPVLALELHASHGDAAAIAKLSDLVESSTDELVRSAWAQSVMRGTRWSVSHRDANAERWTSLTYDERASCTSLAEADWPEVTSDERVYATTTWHGVPIVELVVSASCGDPTPIEIVVDGEHLVASPSAELVRWRVRVRDSTARVALVRGAARVHAVPRELVGCGARWETIEAPRSASSAPAIDFDPEARAPGLEVWKREGAAASAMTVVPRAERDDVAKSFDIVVPSGASATAMVAIDGRGRRWRRVARVALPAWSRGGVSVRGGDDLAVRPIVRIAHPVEGAATIDGDATRPVAATLDEETLVDLTRQLLATPPRDRGPRYLERALYLSKGGAALGALEDAEAAEALGTPGPNGGSAVAHVRASLAIRPASVAPLAADQAAYGIEADFDAEAARCVASEGGPRARLARVVEELAAPPGQVEQEPRGFSSDLASRVIATVHEAPLDPRGPGLVARALAGSRWKIVPLAAAKRAVVERKPRSEGPIDGEGELRPWIAAGGPFDQGTFATIVPGQPARAVLAAPPGVSARLDVACVPRAAFAAKDAACPLDVSLGGKPVSYPPFSLDGRTSVPLKLEAARRALLVAIASPDHGWLALVRIVYDRPLPGTVKAGENEWILTPPRVEHRYLVEPGKDLAAELPRATVLRIDAIGDDDVTLDVRGSARVLPAGGTPVVVPLPEGGRIAVRTSGRAVSVALAERVASEPNALVRSDRAEDLREAKPPEPASTLSLDPTAGTAWRDEAVRSPPPLGPIEASLGTAVLGTGALYGTIREGVPSLPASQGDGYVFLFANYRRRIESINLWTAVGAHTNLREGEPSYGASLVLYEEIEKLHLRLSGTVRVATQRIDNHAVQAVAPRGFVEYSWRATRDFFVLPRLGFDGTYASLVRRPADLSAVDDDVFNPYRARRPAFLFGQVLLWFAPYFDDIFYLRNRLTYNPIAGNVSHVSARPGLFLVLGQLDLNGYVEGSWYSPADSLRRKARIDERLGGTLTYHRWSGMGSVDLQPGIAAFSRLHDGGYQMSVFINVLASYRRGLRDFSSLELDFPEQLGGGIPWRGSTPGGYR